MSSITSMLAYSIARAIEKEREAETEQAQQAQKAKGKRGEAVIAMWKRKKAENRAKMLEAIRAAGKPILRAEMIRGTGVIHGYDEIRQMLDEKLIVRSAKKGVQGYLFGLPEMFAHGGGADAA